MRSSVRLVFVLLVALSLVGTACALRTEQLRNGGGTASAPTVAPTTSGVEPAYHTILEEVATVRGLAAPAHLDVRFVSRKDLPSLLDELLTADDRRWFAETTTLYRLLGHFRRDQNYLDLYRAFGASAVLGLYSPDHDALWIVRDRSEPPRPGELSDEGLETLAHEFVHAIQDAHFDLGATYRSVMDNLDRNLAWTAVVEGDAVYTAGRYRSTYVLLPLGRGFVVARILPAQAGEVPPSLLRELYFPYTTGAEWAQEVVELHGWSRIDSFLREPPLATSIILHPNLVGTNWVPEPVPEPDLAAVLGEGWKRESGGQFGEFSFLNFLRLRLGAAEANRAAGGWSGDAYVVYTNGSAHVAAFELRFESLDDAEEANNALASLLEQSQAKIVASAGGAVAMLTDGREFAWRQRGRSLRVAIADVPDLAPAALRAVGAD